MSINKNRQQAFGFFANQNQKNNGIKRVDRWLFFDPKTWLKRTIIHTIICMILLLLIFSINSIDTRATNKISSEITYRLNQEFKYKDSYTMLMGWGNYLIGKGEETLETLKFVDNSQREFILPMKGDIITYFKEVDTSTERTINGIIIKGSLGEKVVASDEGVVIEASSSQGFGHYIIIKHRGEFISVYKHLNSTKVEVNAKVARGEIVGTASDKLLFEIWQRQNPINPLDHIDYQQINL